MTSGERKLEKRAKFASLVCETPRLQVEVEDVVIYDVLLQALKPAVRLHLADAMEPRVVSPLPQAGGHDIRQHQAVHQFREDEHFHI